MMMICMFYHQHRSTFECVVVGVPVIMVPEFWIRVLVGCTTLKMARTFISLYLSYS